MGHDEAVLSSAGGAILTGIVANLAFGLPGAVVGLTLGALGLPLIVKALRRHEQLPRRP